MIRYNRKRKVGFDFPEVRNAFFSFFLFFSSKLTWFKILYLKFSAILSELNPVSYQNSRALF